MICLIENPFEHPCFAIGSEFEPFKIYKNLRCDEQAHNPYSSGSKPQIGPGRPFALEGGSGTIRQIFIFYFFLKISHAYTMQKEALFRFLKRPPPPPPLSRGYSWFWPPQNPKLDRNRGKWPKIGGNGLKLGEIGWNWAKLAPPPKYTGKLAKLEQNSMVFHAYW